MQQSSCFIKEGVSAFTLRLEMSWCLFLCHSFKLVSRQRLQGLVQKRLGFFDGELRDMGVAKLRAEGMTVLQTSKEYQSSQCLESLFEFLGIFAH